MKYKIFNLFILCFLFFSCGIQLHLKHGSVIHKNDNSRIKIILNNRVYINKEKYYEEIIYSDNEKYKIKIYFNRELNQKIEFSNGHFYIPYENRFNILNVVRIEDNAEIISGFYINPNSNIFLINDKIYCHRTNVIYELDLIKITEKARYIYDKNVEVNLINVNNKYLELSIIDCDLINSNNMKFKKYF